MPCYYPLQAWYPADGTKQLKFKHHADSCGQELEIPCGRCIGCRLERSRQWAVRCVHEASLYNNNAYITLTYSDEHLPLNGSLVKKHFQDFMKRLRKHIEPDKVRYFMCGEYGEKYFRPHYHACLFGYDFPDKVYFKTNNNGDKLYNSKTLEKLWTFGHSSTGDVTFESAAYVARYITKKITGDAAEEHYQRIDPDTGELFSIEPEYTTMSRRPGIAAKWFHKYKKDLDKDFITMRGHKMRPPKYYDKLKDLYYPDEMEVIKLDRQERNRVADKSDNTNDRLRVKEHIKLKKLNLLKRGLEQ